MKHDGPWTSVGPHHSLPIIEQCDDRSARICVVCGKRKPGSHFRIRPLKGAGYRVVCGYCLRGLVSKREPKAKRRR
jgi:hypothetical protein